MSVLIKQHKGFTLLELMLVIVIIVVMAVAGIRLAGIQADKARVDRTALQMQQILEAATSYYINQYNQAGGGQWPQNIAALTGNGYLPSGITYNDAWGVAYEIGQNQNMFTVTATVPSQPLANQLSGNLPIATVTPLTPDTPPYTVTASINIPSYNYNNARAVNNVTYVHPGDCVQQPSCPTGMHAATSLAPVGLYALSGTGAQQTILSFQGFTLYLGTDPLAQNGFCASTDEAQSLQNNGNPCSDGYVRACLHLPFVPASQTTPIDYQDQYSNLYIMVLSKCEPGASQQSLQQGAF